MSGSRLKRRRRVYLFCELVFMNGSRPPRLFCTVNTGPESSRPHPHCYKTYLGLTMSSKASFFLTTFWIVGTIASAGQYDHTRALSVGVV